MYSRESKSGHPIEWDPEDTGNASQALADVNGTGIGNPSEASKDNPVDVDDETARQVRERYNELTEANP